jgi:hypothetical protein
MERERNQMPDGMRVEWIVGGRKRKHVAGVMHDSRPLSSCSHYSLYVFVSVSLSLLALPTYTAEIPSD